MMHVRCRLMVAFSLILLAMSALTGIAANPAPQVAEEYSLRVYADVSTGRIKHGLAGVSLGGNANSYLKPNVVSAVHSLNLRAVRLESVTQTKNYNLYDPAADRYDWSAIDREIENIQSTGAEIILNIFCTPKWLSNNPNGNFWASEPNDYDRWAKYVSVIVKHVNIEKKYNIRYWEIWNEPTNPGFWAPAKNGISGYCKLYDVTVRAIKQADSSAQVGGFGDNMAWPDNFSNFFRYVKENNLPLDFLTVHWYADWNKVSWKQPSSYYTLSTQLTAHHRAVFGKDVPIFLTEWNFTAEKEAYTALEHSAFIASSLYWMQESPIDIAMLFRVEPYKNTLGSVLDPQNKVRGPGRVLAMFSALPDCRLPVYDVPAGVQVMASRDDGSIHLLVSRFDSYATASMKLNFSIANHGWNGPYTVYTQGENPSNGEISGEVPALAESAGTAVEGKSIPLAISLEPFSVRHTVIQRK